MGAGVPFNIEKNKSLSSTNKVKTIFLIFISYVNYKKKTFLIYFDHQSLMSLFNMLFVYKNIEVDSK